MTVPTTAQAGPGGGVVDADAVVEVRGLHFSRGSRVIFRGIDVDIRRGKVTAIMGYCMDWIGVMRPSGVLVSQE